MGWSTAFIILFVKLQFILHFVQIQWLLKDEIVSALRLVAPVTKDTLEMVTNHVKDSPESSNCVHELIDLQFVYGVDRTKPHFIEVSRFSFVQSLHSFCGS